LQVVLATINAKYIHTSLALRYLKEYSKKDFPNIELLEFTINEPVLNILGEIFRRKPDVVGFSIYIWNVKESFEVIGLLKKVLPSVTIVIGGPEVSFDLPYWFKTYSAIDYIVVGEGEVTFHELLLFLEMQQKEKKNLKGVAYIENNSIVYTPSEKIIKLDDIPFPYNEDSPKDLAKRIVYYETSRGCPFNCQYCLSSIEKGVRYFSLERVKSDLKKLLEMGVKQIKFIDRTFNVNVKYTLEIFRFLIAYQKDTTFQFEITADIMKKEIIDFLLQEAPPNIFRFEIGVQTTHDETNRLIDRRQDFSRLSQIVRLLKESKKITQHLDLIAGLPEEDFSRFRITFNDVFALRPNELQLGFLKLLRGTGLRMRSELYGYKYMDNPPYEVLSNNWLNYQDILEIKKVEEMLERYWNSHRVDLTIEYILENHYNSAFDFFWDVGDYWQEHNWRHYGSQLEDLYLRLYQFWQDKIGKDLDIVKGLLQADYLRGQRQKPRKGWWQFSLNKESWQRVIKSINANPTLIREENAVLKQTIDYFKNVIIEKINFDLTTYLTTKTIITGEFFMLVYYEPQEQKIPKIYTISSEELMI